MKRDLEILRAILMDEEDTGTGKLGQWTDEQVLYHRSLLIEAGYLKGTTYHTGDTITLHSYGLSWKGHEFLDATRAPAIWQIVRNRLREHGSTVAIEIALALAKQAAAKILNLP